MKSKMLVGGGLVLAFVVGSMASGIYSGTIRAFNPAPQNAVTPAIPAQTAPAVNHTQLVQPKTVYVSDAPRMSGIANPTHKKRTLDREALIVGGSAGAGAAIGAVAGGGKGAGIGALSGGVAGLVYDLMTRNK